MADRLGATVDFEISPGRTGRLVSLPELERRGYGAISRLPVSLRIVLESLARNVDGQRVTEDTDVKRTTIWTLAGPSAETARPGPPVHTT